MLLISHTQPKAQTEQWTKLSTNLKLRFDKNSAWPKAGEFRWGVFMPWRFETYEGDCDAVWIRYITAAFGAAYK